MNNYKLNKTPLRTSNNYKINDINLDLEIPEPSDFNKYIIDNLEDTAYNHEIKDNFDSKIGLSFSKYLELNIDIHDNKYVEKPIIINKIIESCFVSTININLGNNTKADFIIKFTGDIPYALNSTKIHVIGNSNSNSTISILNLINENSQSFLSYENELNNSSKVTYNIFDLKGNIRLSNLETNLVGYSSTMDINTLYMGKNKDLIDVNYLINHLGKNTNSNINVVGSLNDFSNKHFKGTIDFKEGSSSSVGKEYEDVILLSDNAKTISLPMLLCHEEDVDGSHGVSTGKVDINKLFYIMTRGLSYEDALKLIINGKFNSIINKIPDEVTKQFITDEINKL